MLGGLFLSVRDFVMKRTLERGPRGIRLKFTTKLVDLDFANDLALLSSKVHDIQQNTQPLHEFSKISIKNIVAAFLGMHVSPAKHIYVRR